ncbi:hypothetical protein [Campylobacter devanensis]|uniref:hypothetical protein n=1 Tax=Campylobacter devanensis TaxID=3161138 RepID=UPI000A3460F4|nr:hypothetical protein [Campylobacter sp. P0108]
MTKNGQTANGVAHFAPMMELKAPQWNIRNPFNDLIGIALKEREMELKEKEMGLKEKGLGLDEQKFAYGAANDEINRQHAIELKEKEYQNNLDKVIQEYSLNSKMYNELKAKEDLKEKKNNQYYGLLESLADLGTDMSNPHNFFTAARAYAKAAGLTDVVDFYTNNGAEAAKLNNLFMENRIKKDGVLEAMQKSSGNGNSSDPFDFNNNRTQNK